MAIPEDVKVETKDHSTKPKFTDITIQRVSNGYIVEDNFNSSRGCGNVISLRDAIVFNTKDQLKQFIDEELE